MITFIKEPTIHQNQNPIVPLAAIVQFEASQPVETTLSINDGRDHWELHYTPDKSPVAGLPVVGMRADTTLNIHVTIQSGDEQVTHPTALTFTAPSLPDDPALFPTLQVDASEPDRIEPGLTLVFARRRPAGEPTELSPEQRKFMTSFGLIIALNAYGEVVWYFQSHARIADMTQLRNGNFVFITTEFDVTEVDVLGNIVQTWYATDRPHGPHETAIPVETETIHHCIYELSNGNFMAFTANKQIVEGFYTSEFDPEAPRKTQPVMGDTIIEFTREGKVVWRWNCFDHLDPYRVGYEVLYSYWWVRGFPDHMDWTHGNSMWIDEEENTVLLCLRLQEAIFKIDRSTGEIIWILGEHTDWPEHLQSKLLQPIGNVQWPYHMHTPSITPEGNFMIFDNGVFGARPFTMPLRPAETFGRAVEYHIDEANMTVEEVWASEQKGDPDNLVSYAMGDADWMPETGNVLISYGLSLYPDELEDIGPTEYNRCTHFISKARVREVTHTSPPETVFDVRVINDTPGATFGWACFGAEKIKRLI